MGDMVLKFPNPDHEKYNKNNKANTILYEQKDNIFKKLVLVVDKE